MIKKSFWNKSAFPFPYRLCNRPTEVNSQHKL